MTTATEYKSKPNVYCNVMAMQQGIDPAGNAGSFEDAVITEVPLPWKADMFSDESVLTKESLKLREIWFEEYQRTGKFPHRPLLIAPDDDYSVPGMRRMMFFDRPTGPFATYQKFEYLVPEDQVGALSWTFFQDKPALSKFEEFKVPNGDQIRDIMVCTHGTVDVACARFGIPVFKKLKKKYGSDRLRIWRVSHFGGHLFAPTLIDMPTGHYWAYVEEEQAAQIIERDGDPADVRGHFRGWAALPNGFPQAAEREMWQQEGWDWFDYSKSCTITAQDEAQERPKWAEVEITFKDKSGKNGLYAARVERAVPIDTIGKTNGDKLHPYPQYSVTSLEKR
ncbi:MAG: sucrase ferredoxin [Chloroflexota bacterium]